MKRALFALAAAATLAAVPARAADQAFVWVPAETFASWKDLDAALAAGSARLTVAVSPSMMTREAVASLSSWSAKGRVETALRLDGDPLLPVISSLPAAPRPQDVTDRLAAARERYREAFKAAPAGFVPGAGAVSSEILPGIKAMGLSWVASGEYAGSTGSSGTWASLSGLTVVPMRPWPAEGPGVIVVDEADGLAPEGTLLRLLNSGGAPQATLTVSQAAAAIGPGRPVSTVAAWPAWSGDLKPWTASERAQRAWALYGEAAAAVETYQNSGLANLGALDRATADLYGAQASRFYRDVPPEQASAPDQELRSRLQSVYRRIHRAPPDSLFAAAPGAVPDAADQPTGVHVSQGADWAQFDNPPGSIARPPVDQASQDPAAAKPYALRSLRVELSADSVVFTYTLDSLVSDPSLRGAAVPQLGRLLLETYVDINHVMGAGATQLLADRSAFIQSRDAWEYALSVSAWGAQLYRSSADGEPAVVADPVVAADLKSGKVTVTVPRSALSGNPLHWGFIAASYEADVESAARPPVRPVLPNEGTAILGLIAPLDQQRALSDAARHPRLAAVRASDAAAN